MSDTSETIDPKLAESLRARSDEDLISIFEKPDDWRPEVVEYARSELTRRSISPEQIRQRLAEDAKQKAEELQRRSSVPLSFWQSFFTVFYGVVFGLLGLLVVWPRASRFRSSGYVVKATNIWRLYWLGFGVRAALVVIFIIVAVWSGLTNR
jgi:hypothetical protein